MGTGGKVILRRAAANGGGGKRGRRRKRNEDEDDEDDEEYVAEEEDEEDGDESLVDENEDEEDGEVGDSDELEEGEDEFDEEEEEFVRSKPKRTKNSASNARIGSRKPRSRGSGDEDADYVEEFEYDDLDDDFDPDLDEEEDDFDPDLDEEEEEEVRSVATKKIRVKNGLVKKKSGRKRKGRKSRVSKKKSGAKTTRRRKRRRRSVNNDDEEEEEDEDFTVKDRVEVRRRGRKKTAAVGRKKRRLVAVTVPRRQPSLLDSELEEPEVDSETSEFEFVTSDEEEEEDEFVEERVIPVEQERVSNKGKRRRKRAIGSGSEESSDSDYVISEEELRDLGIGVVPDGLQLLPPPPPPPKRVFVTRNGEHKGKGKEAEEAGKPTCGICLSEEQRATVQGVLDCCSHYFCFACIMEWSKVESRCPLCKRRFGTITKSSKSDLGLGLRKAVIRVEKRDQVYLPSEEELRGWLDPYENVVCIECHQGGDDYLMLLCDLCDSSAHTYCVGLGREVPEGNWYCECCRVAGERSSYTQVRERVVAADVVASTTNGFRSAISQADGSTAHSGVFQQSTPATSQFALPEIDLNLLPRDLPDEDPVTPSPLSGRRATLSGRRAIQQHIRILLSNNHRPRNLIIRSSAFAHGIHQSESSPGIERIQQTLPASMEEGNMQAAADVGQNQQNSRSFIPSYNNLTDCTSYRDSSNFQHVEGAKEQVQRMVKNHLKQLCSRSGLDYDTFKNIARRATHTILAACGIEHNGSMVVAILPPPRDCLHDLDGQEPAFLPTRCCSSCFSAFACDVVKNTMDFIS